MTPGVEERVLHLSHGNAPYDVHLQVMRIGEDLLGIVTGGTRAHIGAVALAEPAINAHPVTGEIPHSKNATECAAQGTAAFDKNATGNFNVTHEEKSLIPVLIAAGHKDAVIARMFAQALCQKYGVNVCCSAGIHVDNASSDEIEKMIGNAQALLKTV
jgi:hypothetical protein